jgi:hypothetical protein
LSPKVRNFFHPKDQGPKENNCFPGLVKDNFRDHTPESVSDLNLLFSGCSLLSLVFALLIHNKQSTEYFAVSGVQSSSSNLGATYFHFRRATFLNQLKSKCGLILGKTATLRVNLNLDGDPITSTSYTHPSHSQTSRLFTSSLSLGVPDPRPTQCMRDS